MAYTSDAISGWARWALAHLEFGSLVNPFPTKGQIKLKSRLESRRFSQKNPNEFDLFVVKSKKNKTNSSVRFLGEVSRP